MFRDLKPYVCTFQGCDMMMFRSRNEWFSHELQNHRREWVCQYCQHASFPMATAFSDHIRSSHPAMLAGTQLEALLMQSEEAVDTISALACPLCDEWETNTMARHTKQESTIKTLHDGDLVDAYGTRKQFRRHLGRHMEQLALFALPMTEIDDADNDSTDAGDDDDPLEELEVASDNHSASQSVSTNAPAPEEPHHGPDYKALSHLLNDMQNHSAAWPFMLPVDKNEDAVADYYEVIKEPMDLETMEKKLEADKYATIEDFVRDATLIFNNCRKYHNATTPYSHAAIKLEKFMWAEIKMIPEWSHIEP